MDYNKDWYNNLVKPSFQPPDMVFTPVWIFLYILMTAAFLLVLIKPFSLLKLASILLFFLQMYVNLQWPLAFFKEHNLRKSFLLAVLLALLVFLTMVLFFFVSKIAGVMFLPYFLWCCFASVLSFHLLELNEW